jgi:GT2 family glycosyltransferase
MEHPSDPLVCAVVPAFNRCEKTLRFLHSFSKIAYPNRRVIIVDDGSSDGTRQSIELNFPDVTVLVGDGNLWWSGGTNRGIEHALKQGADYILTINDDGVMEPDFLCHMVEIARQDLLHIVGCRLQCQDDPDEVWSIGTTLALNAGTLFSLNFAGQRWSEIRHDLPNPYPVQSMAGNGVLIPRAVFERVGMYDAENMPQYHADSDLVMRARAAGFKPVISLNSVLYNHILEVPLVNNRIDLVFSKKSDRYWRAIWATLKRHAPWGRRTYLLLRQYSPFFFNGPVLGRGKRLLRWLLERPPKRTETGVLRGYNPTCDAGPAVPHAQNE